MDMKPGVRFDTKGYWFVARAECIDGDREAILMHNESSHYLLAVREMAPDGESPTEGEATFLQSWSYAPSDAGGSKASEEDLNFQYKEGLIRMVELASTP